MLSKVAENIFICNLNYKDILREDILREVTVKIGLEGVDIQEEVMVEALLGSRAIELVISSEFARK